MIGGQEIIVIIFIPIALLVLGFFIGFSMGKKSGYIKRVKETEQ